MAGEGLVDADALLRVTELLTGLRDRVEAAGVSDERRLRWQRRLAAIADGAQADLGRAEAQLRRFTGELDRVLPDAGAPAGGGPGSGPEGDRG